MLISFPSGFKAAAFGGSALFAVIFFASGIPRVQKDILQKVPVFGNLFVKEIHPADNVSLRRYAAIGPC